MTRLFTRTQILLAGGIYLFAAQPSFAQAMGHSSNISLRGVIVFLVLVVGAYWLAGYYFKNRQSNAGSQGGFPSVTIYPLQLAGVLHHAVKLSGDLPPSRRRPSGNVHSCSRYSSRASSFSLCLKNGRLIAFMVSGSIRDQTTCACRRPSFSCMTMAWGCPSRPSFARSGRARARRTRRGSAHDPRHDRSRTAAPSCSRDDGGPRTP